MRTDCIALRVEPLENGVTSIGSDGNLVTDNGNYIVDAQTGPTISNPSQTEAELLHIAGVVQVGLFTNMCDVVILAGADGVSVLEKEDTS